MRNFLWRATLLALLLTVIAAGETLAAGRGQLLVLQRNPFLAPALVPETGAGAEPRKFAAEGALQIRGILYDGDDSIVNLNGVLLKKGQFFGDYQVLQVEKRKVVLLKKDGGRLVVLMAGAGKSGADEHQRGK